MSNARGLLFIKNNLLASDTYLASDGFSQSVTWRHTGTHDELCLRATPSRDDAITISFVAVPVISEWHNRLSGLGDYNDRVPKPFDKLKWILHLRSPTGTVFMQDWHVGIATLQTLQQRVERTTPNDLLIVKDGRVTELRTTARMLKCKQTVNIDSATDDYAVPTEHIAAWADIARTHVIDPINIRTCTGRAVPMGEGAEKAIGGSLCLITFQLKHYYFSSVHRDSFCASLKSVKILVPKPSMSRVVKETAGMDLSVMNAPNMLATFLRSSTAASSDQASSHSTEDHLAEGIRISVPGSKRKREADVPSQDLGNP